MKRMGNAACVLPAADGRYINVPHLHLFVNCESPKSLGELPTSRILHCPTFRQVNRWLGGPYLI
jgi:hypothetical protein